MVGELIGLRFAVQRHTPRWKRLVGLVLGVAAVAATWAAMLLAAPQARGDVLALAMAGWLVGWVVGPILSSGASVLRPEYFALLPLPRSRLGAGLLVSVFAGVGAAVTGAAMLAPVGYGVAVATGPRILAAVAVGLVATVLLVVCTVALSRAVYALLGAAMRTRLGVEIAAIQYGLLVAALFAGWVLVFPLVQLGPTFLRRGFTGPGSDVASAVFGWLPSGWPVRAVEAAAAGEPGTALGYLSLLALAAAVAVTAAVVLLTPYTGNRTARRRRRPIGSRRPWALLPATPLGAVLGKELRSWWRDPWRGLEVRTSFWFGIFLAAFAALAGFPELAAFAGIGAAVMVALSGGNLYGQDGTALWQLVVGQSRHAVRADVRGRQLGLVLALGPVGFGLCAVFVLVTGAWDFAVPAAALLFALLGVGSGLAVLISVVAVTPGVDPHRRAHATDAGENVYAGMAAVYAVQLFAAPAVAMAVLLAIDPSWLPGWWAGATLVVGLVDGVLVGWVLGGIAVRRLGGHLPETFARLSYPKIRHLAGGGGLLDRLSGAAEESATAARNAA